MNQPENTPASDCPYPGLRPFTKAEDLLFFGRNEQIDEILRRLKTHQFLGIVGSSGCGKSSLIRAGVLPALESGLMGQLGSTWYVVDMKPGDAPIFNLASALLKSGVLGEDRSTSPEAVGLLAATLRQSDVSLVRLLAARQLPRFSNVVILADQFEEIFRFQQRDADEALAFVNLLLATAADRTVPACVLLTMRSDFLGQCAAFPGLPEVLNDSQFLCPRLTRLQLREAIQLPALGGGGEVTDELAAQLINDAGANSDQLPLIQHALARLWYLTKDRRLTLEQYQQTGGLVGGASADTAHQNTLSGHLDEVYQQLQAGRDARLSGEAAQWIAQMLFRSLAERGSGGQLIRSPRQLSVIAEIVRRDGQSSSEAEADVVWVVERFREPERSFLVPPVPKPLTADTVLDISHEALIRQWRKLSQKWLDEEEQYRRRYRRLAEAADTEATAGLLKDPELSFLEKWWNDFRPREAWAEGIVRGSFRKTAEFLKRSREAVTAEQSSRRRRLGALAGVILAAAAGWGYDYSVRADRAREDSRQKEGQVVAERFLASPAVFLDDLSTHRDIALPILKIAYDKKAASGEIARQKLHAAYGLARYQPSPELLKWLTTAVDTLDASEFMMMQQVLQRLLEDQGREPGEYVRKQLQRAVDAKQRYVEMRWLLMGLALGESTQLDACCAAKPNPSDTTELMLDLAKVPIDLTWLSGLLDQQSRVQPDTRYVLCLVIGGLQGSGVAAQRTLEQLYQTAPDAGTHAAARWALLQQGLRGDELDKMIAERGEKAADAPKRDWFVTPDGGLTMVRIRSHPTFRLGRVSDAEDNYSEVAYPSDWTVEDLASVDEFWMSDREVSVAQFRAICPEHPYLNSTPDNEVDRQPMRDVNWFDALIFCNRLSQRHGLPPYYHVNEALYDWENGRWEAWSRENGARFPMFPSIPNLNGTGYRLPTEREWEYGCRALSTTAYVFGSDANHLSLFGWFAGKSSPAACGSQHPSRWGLNDMHGNVWEWCWDRSDEIRGPSPSLNRWWDHELKAHESSRVLRGGSFGNGSPDILRSAYRNDNSPGSRYNDDGFRISRTK